MLLQELFEAIDMEFAKFRSEIMQEMRRAGMDPQTMRGNEYTAMMYDAYEQGMSAQDFLRQMDMGGDDYNDMGATVQTDKTMMKGRSYGADYDAGAEEPAF